MDLTRRALFRSAAVVGGAVAVGGSGLAAEAVAGTTGTLTHTTIEARVLKGKANSKGWRPLVKAPGEAHLVRTDLGVPAQKGRAGRRTPVLVFAQLSDVHILDAQSPARLEGGEQFSPSAYRPQEVLTAHIAEAMVRQLNRSTGPVTGSAPEFALQTGDNSDNGQYNEIRWNIDILDGEMVTPDSGDLTRYEGVMDGDPAYYNPKYWHPAGAPAGKPVDNYRRLSGFPKLPTLLDQCRKPFQARGLAFPWYAVFGNHDELVQGNFPRANNATTDPTGTQKRVSLADGSLAVRTVTADANRRFLTRGETVDEHFVTTGLPAGHGFTQDNVTNDTGYYTVDQGPGGIVRFIVLDTVNPNGGSDGSLDQAQFTWLQQQLAAATDKIVIVSSHHTSWSSDNAAGGNRVLGGQIVTELLAHPHVVAWVNGHTHRNEVRQHTNDTGGFWEINTAAHIDWPQHSRLVEILDNNDGSLSLFCTMVDHAAQPMVDRFDTTMQLASLGRLLAANDPQERASRRQGGHLDRNVELLVAKPAGLPV